MPYYRSVGEIPRKRHTQFRSPDGSLYAEELMGVEGFSSDSALLYHRFLPTAIVDAEVVEDHRGALTPNHPLMPRHFRTQDLKSEAQHEVDAVTGRRTLFGNGDLTIAFAIATAPSPLYRNAAGDELIYVQTGAATVETIYGALEVTDGDYVVLPTSTTYRVLPHGETRLYILEATGHVGPPKRYLSTKGQFLEHAPYCERDQRGPAEPLQVDGTDVPVLVRHRAGLTKFNVDSDELMFYVGGNYEARKGSGIGLGSLSLHPSGFTHGPQPGAPEAALGVDYFDETAVMVDTFRPLDLGEGAIGVEDANYAWSWSGRGPRNTME